MITLYALCGLPFAGKSTAARALQLRTNAALVQLDAINAERGPGLDGSAIPQHEWQRTYVEAYRRIARHLAEGRSVIFDHGNFSRSERDQVRAIARRMAATVRFVYVPISPDEAPPLAPQPPDARALRRARRRLRASTSHVGGPVGEPDVVNIGNLEALLAE